MAKLPVKGLHHVTSIAGDPNICDRFWRQVIGLRRVKQTVNFDNPEIYHLYFGDRLGSPGTIMTYFPFPGRARGRGGTAEVAVTNFSVSAGSAAYWMTRLGENNVGELELTEWFGRKAVGFAAPDGDRFLLIEHNNIPPTPAGADIDERETAILGFSGVTLRLADSMATAELLEFMGYERGEHWGHVTRYTVAGGNGANHIDIETRPGFDRAEQGAGSVHHVAFAVDDRAAQLAIRHALVAEGWNVTAVIDRNYFWSIYFRTPGGVLFEIATDEPGFDHDEDRATMGRELKLPAQHEHLREHLRASLLALDAV